MTFFGGGGSMLGSMRSADLAQTASRTQILGRRYQSFSNPFFDQASTYTPPTIKSLFGFCRFYHLTHGIINAVNTKASEYPITDIIIQDSAKGVVDKWEELMLGILNYRVHQFEFNLDLHVYGNTFISPSFPFRKKLKCTNCRAEHDALLTRPQWRYMNHQFWLQCTKCGQSDFAKSYDDYMPKASEIGLIRWNPELVQIFYNEATGRTDYGLDLSPDFRAQVMMGRKDLVATTPEIILEMVKTRRILVFDKKDVFHMRRSGLSGMDRGWGMPLLLPVLKDAFYMQIMKKAQEVVLMTQMLPQTFLFPQPATAGADPFCVSPETIVETIEGLRPAAEVEEGDYLRSHTGAWCRVERKISRPVPREEKTYRFTVRTLPGFPFVVSEDHPIYASPNPNERNGRRFDSAAVSDLEFIEAKKLRAGDFVAYPVKRTKRSSVTLDLAELSPHLVATEKHAHTFDLDKNWARIIGYFVAKGDASHAKTTFSFAAPEDAFVEELRDALKAVGYDLLVDSGEGDGASVHVYSALLAGILRALCGKGPESRRIPSVISEAPDELCFEALRCLFNGSGIFIVSDDKGTLRVCLKTINPAVALEARRLLLSFGFIGGVSRTVPNKRERAKQPYYQVYYNGVTGGRLANAFGWNKAPAAHVEPSPKNAFIRGDYLYMRIASVEETDTPEVIGFQIHGDKTFCVAGVATHNTTVDLANWREHIRRELARQRMDPAYYGILPFPLGHQTIGENGRSLLLMPEIQQLAEMIVVGMGFPVDLVFGHGTYAGSSVNMRMLENFFLSNVHGQHRLLHWVMRRFGAFLNWPVPQARFKPFKMADDVQRQALMLQLNQLGKVSDTALLSPADLKVEDEASLIVREAVIRQEAVRKQQLLMAEAQGEAQLVAAKFQAQAQTAMEKAVAQARAPQKDPFTNAVASSVTQQPGMSLDAVASALAQRIQLMPPDQQQAYLRQLQEQVPEMAGLVQEQQAPQEMQQAQQQSSMNGGAGPQIDARPRPEVLPPRRQNGAAL